jgi:hypothetical protein
MRRMRMFLALVVCSGFTACGIEVYKRNDATGEVSKVNIGTPTGGGYGYEGPYGYGYAGRGFGPGTYRRWGSRWYRGSYCQPLVTYPLGRLMPPVIVDQVWVPTPYGMTCEPLPALP